MAENATTISFYRSPSKQVLYSVFDEGFFASGVRFTRWLYQKERPPVGDPVNYTPAGLSDYLHPSCGKFRIRKRLLLGLRPMRPLVVRGNGRVFAYGHVPFGL